MLIKVIWEDFSESKLSIEPLDATQNDSFEYFARKLNERLIHLFHLKIAR